MCIVGVARARGQLGRDVCFVAISSAVRVTAFVVRETGLDFREHSESGHFEWRVCVCVCVCAIQSEVVILVTPGQPGIVT